MKTIENGLRQGRITRWICLATLLAVFVFAASTQARVFVATNSTWRYFKGTSEASTPTNAWRELAFDDSSWLTGAAPFHYGTNAVGGDDNLTGGTILSDMRSHYTCVFLRQEFVIDDPDSVRGLWLNVGFDDGLAIWINGQPPRAPIYLGGLAYTNTANTAHEGTALSRLDLSGAIASLRSGTNVLCLQAVNQSLTDDDFRINAELAEMPSTFVFATNAYTVREDATQLVVRVVRTHALDAGMSVSYATTNGSAVAGSDYEAVAGTLAFGEGQAEQTIPVRIFNDVLSEGTEEFQLTLTNPGGGATLGSPSTATVQITELMPAGRKWLTVAAVTMSAQTNTEANLQTFYAYMARAASHGADLVVFPETALQQCPAWGPASHTPTPEEMTYVRQTAETIPGWSTTNVVAKAKELNLFVVFGMTEKDQADLLYNASVFLGPHGVIGKHRKRYLGGAGYDANEDQIWRPGQVWDVVDSPLGKVGLLICLEMAYNPGPVLAGQGANLLVTSSAWWSTSASPYDQVTTSIASQARRWHVVSDQTGMGGLFSLLGHSRVVDPLGRIVCDTGSSEGLVTWETDILIDARPFEDRPFILTQPTNQSVRAGGSATFRVSAYDYDPASLTYRWQFHGVAVDGATNAILTLTNVQMRHAGTYTVVVTDANGSVTSAPVVLAVLFDPVIVQQPCSVSVPQGGSVVLSVAVTNTATLPIGYRWGQRSTVAHAVLNQYLNFLTVTNCQVTATYEVIVTNLTGVGIRSSNAVVTVLAEADGDGLPDAWEIACGINPAATNHATADDDGDGLSNLEEYLAGTDPTNALRYLKVKSITLAEQGSKAVLSFFAVSNTTYTVQYCDAVGGEEWRRLADVAAASTNRVLEVLDPAVGSGSSQRVYRLATPRVP